MIPVIQTPRAEVDLIEHYARIALDKLDPALRFLKVAEETFELIARMPRIGRKWESDTPRLVGLRVYPLPRSYRSYLVFYRILDDGIEVVRVLHGARDIESVLEVDT
jgi:toxin ParE1/3/4